MTPRGQILFTLLGLTVWNAAAAQVLTASQVFETAASSVVVVEAIGTDGSAIAQGSGVVIARDSVVTNCHVVDGAFSVRVREHDEVQFGTLEYRDVERDLCQLAVPGLKSRAATFRKGEPLRVGEAAFAIGAPRGLDLTLSDGLISGLRPVGDSSMIQTTAAISPGSSGGGLFDARGRLIGITTLQFKDSQALNFAVPVDWIDELPSRGREAAEAERRASQELASWNKRVAAAKADVDALVSELERTYVEYKALYPEFLERSKTAVQNVAPESWREKVAAVFQELLKEHRDSILNGAPRWRIVYETDLERVSLDLRSVERSGDFVTAWHQFEFRAATAYGPNNNVKRVLIKDTWNCARHTYKIEALIMYDPNGRSLEGSTSQANRSFSAVAPDSTAEVQLVGVCQYAASLN
jgi:hypothetical protein